MTKPSAPTTPRQPLRPPAAPLVVCDPYFSIWSFADRLTDDATRHWTGAKRQLRGLLRVDGKAFRFLGGDPKGVEPAEQRSLEVLPTRTIAVFAAGGVRLTVTFTTPALPHDLDALGKPVTYVAMELEAEDGRAHDCALCLHVDAMIALEAPHQAVRLSRYRLPGIEAIAMGSAEQAVLARSGDDLRIDWGHCYLAVARSQEGRLAIDCDAKALESFIALGVLPEADELDFPRPASRGWPGAACAFDVRVPARGGVSRWAVLAYDDIWSIEYLERRLRPWWRRHGAGPADLFAAAVADYPELAERCRAFDQEFLADCRAVGGDDFADLASLSFRQCLAAHKLVADADGRPMYFSKENFSNGCIATVDVTYPSAPFFLLLNPELLRAQLRPVLAYAALPRWPWPYAPHDLGTYPLANGQVYGGGEKTERHQMPVEECGNMLLLVTALAQAEGDAGFAAEWWPLLTRWARYLREQGFDPADQLCTDDFAGPMAHNANLSLKAILALAGYAQLCRALGRTAEADEWRAEAETMAKAWQRAAADGDHYRLAFDQPGTWSQKYNLVWDRLLGLDLFPAAVARTEVAAYRRRQNRYGLPLDNRKDYGKLDWTVWTATLTGDADDFAALVAPLRRWAHETPTRVPLTDWFSTIDGAKTGFQARSVVGGVLIPFLADRARWRKWVERALPERMRPAAKQAAVAH